MNMEDEIHVYECVEVSCVTGETESYEPKYFQNIIRKREIELIKHAVQAESPNLVLDYGCGGGWLSRLMCKWDFRVVGVDLSKRLVRVAKHVCGEGDFVVCDATRLPFRDNAFDFIVGISILHHLHDLRLALKELRRISVRQAVFLFMEPNSLNPISAFGRKFFPMEAHTKGEKQFTYGYLKKLSLANFRVERYFAMFFFSFPIARFLKIARMKLPLWLVKMFSLLEAFAEKMPLLRCLNSNIVDLVKLQ